MPNLLVLDHSRHNWFHIFDDAYLDNGDKIVIEQCNPNNINFQVHSHKKLTLELMPDNNPIEGSTQNTQRKFSPDLVLVKKVNRKMLYGLQFADSPAINSLSSIYANLERPIVFGGLISIQQDLGQDNFPLIEQIYHPDHQQMYQTPTFPIVAKVGAAHAGFGKMRFEKNNQFQDFVSVMALYPDYVTTEPYYEVEYDFRVQKIGNNYRGFKRTSAHWKANMGHYLLEELPLTSQHKRWADECSKLFGGMDILALDVIHTKEGEDYIIELNDCNIGFPAEFREESLIDIRSVVLDKLNTMQ